MRIGAAGRLKMGVTFSETSAEQTLVGFDEGFVGSPASGGVLLGLLNHLPYVLDGVEVLRISEDLVSSCSRAQRVAVAVSMTARQHILAPGERLKVSSRQKKLL